MITIRTPANKGNYQQHDFGPLTFNYPSSINASLNSNSIIYLNSSALVVGMTVVGNGIPTGSTIVSIPDALSIVISSSATITGASTLSFTITTFQIDEIILSGVAEADTNVVSFIKRYSTWLIYTYTKGGTFMYNVTFLSYDRTNQIAYTYNDTIRLVIEA